VRLTRFAQPSAFFLLTVRAGGKFLLKPRIVW
jgi:hypothetical protein